MPLRLNTIKDLETYLTQAVNSEQATFIDLPTHTAAELTPLVALWITAECKPEGERVRKSY